jgi:hypothetical protein
MGIGLLDENAHAPNEKLDLDNLHHGMLFEELAETGNGKVWAALLTSRTARWMMATGPFSVRAWRGWSDTASSLLPAHKPALADPGRTHFTSTEG